MEQVALGRSGIAVSRIILGCGNFGGIGSSPSHIGKGTPRDEAFRLLVDRTLSELYRSGEIGALYAEFFGEPDESALEFFRWSALPE